MWKGVFGATAEDPANGDSAVSPPRPPMQPVKAAAPMVSARAVPTVENSAPYLGQPLSSGAESGAKETMAKPITMQQPAGVNRNTFFEEHSGMPASMGLASTSASSYARCPPGWSMDEWELWNGDFGRMVHEEGDSVALAGIENVRLGRAAVGAGC